MDHYTIQQAIESGKTALGIELGSTRIKAVLIGKDHAPIASGSFEWENQYENGVWTYSLDNVGKVCRRVTRPSARRSLRNIM